MNLFTSVLLFLQVLKILNFITTRFSIIKIYLFVVNNNINNKGLWTKKSYFLIFIEDVLRKKGGKKIVARYMILPAFMLA